MAKKKIGRKNILVLGCKGCGSAIAEIFLSLGGIPYDREEVNYDEPKGKNFLLQFNPLAQVPTIVLKDKTILTETLAVAHYVNKLKPKTALIPKDMKNFVKFSRWSTFMISTMYPTWTYGDFPEKWAGKGNQTLQDTTNEHRKKMWLEIEKEVEGPFFLGKKMSAIDVYFAVMSNWRPRKEWMSENCPKIWAAAERVRKLPRIQKAYKLNFD